MAKFKFTLEAGCFSKKQVKIELERSKEKLEWKYPGSTVSIREEKDFAPWLFGGTTFYVQGKGFPDTDEFVKVINSWNEKMKLAAQDSQNS
jgi:hypothetical protein